MSTFLEQILYSSTSTCKFDFSQYDPDMDLRSREGTSAAQQEHRGQMPCFPPIDAANHISTGRPILRPIYLYVTLGTALSGFTLVIGSASSSTFILRGGLCLTGGQLHLGTLNMNSVEIKSIWACCSDSVGNIFKIDYVLKATAIPNQRSESNRVKRVYTYNRMTFLLMLQCFPHLILQGTAPQIFYNTSQLFSYM